MPDNAYIEASFHSMKPDIYHGLRFADDEQVRLKLRDYNARCRETKAALAAAHLRLTALWLGGQATHDSTHPRGYDGHGRKCQWPRGGTAPEPLPQEPLVDPLVNCQDNGGYDADHDGG